MKALAIVTIIVVCNIPMNALASEVEEIFRESIERNVDRIIESWIRDDEGEMRKSMVDLVRYEKNMFAIKQEEESFEYSYLAHIPKALSFKNLAPYLYLLREQKRGVKLLPLSSFYEGRTFTLSEVAQ